MPKETTIRPPYRFALKSRIIDAGYKTLTDFSKDLNTDLSTISRVVSGWELPSPKLQKDITKVLCITLRELNDLLHQGFN